MLTYSCAERQFTKNSSGSTILFKNILVIKHKIQRIFEGKVIVIVLISLLYGLAKDGFTDSSDKKTTPLLSPVAKYGLNMLFTGSPVDTKRHSALQ